MKSCVKYPEGWQEKRLRFIGRVNPQKSEIKNLDPLTGVSFLAMEAIGEDGTLNPEVRMLDDVYEGYTYFKNEDVIIAKITPCFENGKGSIVESLSSGIGFGTTELHVVRANEEVDPKFLYYITVSHLFRKLGQPAMLGASGHKRIPENYVKDFWCGFPLVEEQKIIVEFLDRRIQKINNLIKKKQKLIDLLREKRMAIITRAVTKGLDPAIEMRSSGMEWLGMIPRHWAVKKLKFSVNLINEKVEIDGKFSNYMGLENVESWTGRFVTTESFQDFDGEANSYEKRDVLFGKLRPYLAKVFLSPSSGVCTSEFLILREKDLISEYLFYYLINRDFIDVVDSSTYGAKMPRANWDFIGNLLVLVPPKEEQRKTSDFLNTQTQEIDLSIRKIDDTVNLLIEYKISLISSVITGKIDIRRYKEETVCP